MPLHASSIFMFFPGDLLLAAVRAVAGGDLCSAPAWREGPMVPEGYLELDFLEVGKLTFGFSILICATTAFSGCPVQWVSQLGMCLERVPMDCHCKGQPSPPPVPG